MQPGDISEVYRALKDIDYNGWITIESFVPD
jgi:sugar phosphate isomerase/epimerase